MVTTLSLCVKRPQALCSELSPKIEWVLPLGLVQETPFLINTLNIPISVCYYLE